MSDVDNNKKDLSDFTLDRRTRPKPYSPAPKRDVESVEVSDLSRSGGDSASFKIPPRNEARSGTGYSRNIRTGNYRGNSAYTTGSHTKRGPEGETTEREYGKDNGCIRRVTVKSRAGASNFYGKFVRDAQISHEKRGSSAPHVPFFSYIPQYSQLSNGNWAYYLYMKEQLREGKRLNDADFSYVMLYIYEILNLGHVILPEEGIDLLGRIWILYGPIHPVLDKYLAEWVADYCLVFNVHLPQFMARLLPDVASKSTLKEFFFDEAVRLGVPIGKIIRTSLSDYSSARSRYSKEIPTFSSEVNEVFDAVIAEHLRHKEGLFSPQLEKSATVTRDVYCGSLCASNVRKKAVCELSTFFRAPEARRIVTELMKSAENIVRARHGIKARLTAPPISGTSAVISAKTEEERQYLSFYDSPSEPLTASRAAEIENASWQNVDTLTSDGVFEDGFDENDVPEGAVSSDDVRFYEDGIAECSTADTEAGKDHRDNDGQTDGEASFSSVLSATPSLAEALRVAMDGGGFSAWCRENGLFAHDAASRINEVAMEYIGDVVLESDGGDYSFVEDYREDVEL